MVRATTAVGSAVEGRHKPANACHGSVGGCPCRQETQPRQQGALAAVAAIESAGRDEEAGEDDDGGIDRPQQVAGSGMQLVTVCRLEGDLFGPGPGSGPGPGPGPKRVVVGCGTRRLFPARRSQPELPCPAPELDR